jgi:hypothetical protein
MTFFYQKEAPVVSNFINFLKEVKKSHVQRSKGPKGKKRTKERELSIRGHWIKKKGALIILHSVWLEDCLERESVLLALKGGSTSIEYEIIPLLPDCPGRYYEEFHEEVVNGMPFGLFHHCMER